MNSVNDAFWVFWMIEERKRESAAAKETEERAMRRSANTGCFSIVIVIFEVDPGQDLCLEVPVKLNVEIYRLDSIP